MKKRAIVLQSYGLFPDFRVQRQIDLLRGLGLEIHALICRRTAEDRSFPPPDVDLHVVNIKSKHGLSFLELILFLPKFWAKSFHLLRGIRPDLIVCNNFDTLLPAVCYKLLNGCVIVYESREPYYKVVLLKTGSKLLEQLFWWLEKITIGRVDRVVTVTPNLVKMYRKMGRESQYFPNAPTSHFINNSFPKTPGQTTTIGFVGNIRPGFSIKLVWEVVRDINRDAGQTLIRLLICGPQLAGMEKVVREMVEEGPDWIEVLPPVKVEDIPGIYRRVDIAFSLPENNEKFSNFLVNVKLFESLAAGVPAVCNNIGENREILGDSQSVIWVENDYQAVRDGIEKLVNDPDLRREMGAVGRTFVKEQFNWGKYEEEYREILVKELGLAAGSRV